MGYTNNMHKLSSECIFDHKLECKDQKLVCSYHLKNCIILHMQFLL